jgi:hypothetical protein
VANVRLDYTLDGASWMNLTPSVGASTGSFSWLVPDAPTTGALVQVSDASDPVISDLSDGPFTIVASGGGPAQVFLNEILANEPGSSTSGEFIEVVNAGGGAADLGGWSLSDASGARHVFASGASLPPGAAIVIFGSASAIPPGLSNAVASSSGGLSLANSGDSVILKDAGGDVIDSVTYSSALAGTDAVSMNRSPDASPAGAFVLHTALSAASASPGERADGSSF